MVYLFHAFRYTEQPLNISKKPTNQQPFFKVKYYNGQIFNLEKNSFEVKN